MTFTVIITPTQRRIHIHLHLISIIHMTYATGTKSRFGDIQITVIITAALGMLVMVAGRSGVTLTKFVDGSIIKDGVIN